MIRDSSVLITGMLHIQVFWDVTSCALVNSYRVFEEL